MPLFLMEVWLPCLYSMAESFDRITRISLLSGGGRRAAAGGLTGRGPTLSASLRRKV